MNEFSVIDQYFKRQALSREDVVYGIGDDAACVRVPAGMDLFISTDTLVSDVHFSSDWDPFDIAYKAVMVNVSDITAMAANPAWLSLALSMPTSDESWLKRFSKGLHKALGVFGISLIGGDTTQGPLTITISIHGLAPVGQGVRRKGAKASDIIWVSGDLGGAALALSSLKPNNIAKKDMSILLEKLKHPTPKVNLVPILQTYATSAIDISDGLAQDLNHICIASQVAARLSLQSIPLHPLLTKYQADKAIELALHGGDDYELCFTTPAESLDAFRQACAKSNVTCHPIGIMEDGRGLLGVDKDDKTIKIAPKGYQHFQA